MTFFNLYFGLLYQLSLASFISYAANPMRPRFCSFN